jgi:hypothetical protein
LATSQISTLSQRNLSLSPCHPVVETEVVIALIKRPHAQTTAGFIPRHSHAPDFPMITAQIPLLEVSATNQILA